MFISAGELFERYHGVVYRRCLALLRHEDDAAEAVQEVFVAAVSGLGRFRLKSSPLTWLYAIATRHCLQELRNRSSRALKDSLWLSPPGAVAPDLSARAELEKVLGTLTERELVLFAYAFRDGLTQEEMAELMRTSRKSVGKWLKALDEKLARLRPEGAEALTPAPEQVA